MLQISVQILELIDVDIKIIEDGDESLQWLLATGFWNDSGVWVDSATWND